MGTIRFELRTEKVDKTGKAPVRIIYQLSGQRKYYNTGKKLFPECWNTEKQQAIYLDKKTARKLLPAVDYESLLTNAETEKLNHDLSNYRERIKKIEQRFIDDNIIFTAAMVIEKLSETKAIITKKEAPSKYLFDFIDKYIEDHKSTREPGSLTVYKSLKGHLQDYQQVSKKKITFENIDYSFFQSFQNFLLDKKKYFPDVNRVKSLNNTTVAKQLSTIKTFLNYARKHGVSVTDKYKDFKIKRENLEVIALTNEEFETLYYFDLSNNKKLAQVRDIFCFACTTGLRYSDLAQLKKEHIKKDEIKLTIKKTKEPLTIPLTPYSIAILTKYEALYRPLPIISNQKLNDYIKELAALANINEPVEIVRFKGPKREATIYPKYQLLGVHTGRRTFASLSLERGMSAEEVMTITGHKDYKSFKRYVKVTEQRKKAVMIKAWGSKISDVSLKAI